MNTTKPHRNRFALSTRPTRLANFKAKRKALQQAKATAVNQTQFLMKHIHRRQQP